MKVVKKKIITLCMIFTLCLGMSLAVSAAEIYTYGYFNYKVEDKSVTITDYFGKETEVTVPSMIVGYPVSKIAEGAFVDCKTVEQLNLPDTVMVVEDGALGSFIEVTYNINTDNPVSAEKENEEAVNEVKSDNAEENNSQNNSQNNNQDSSAKASDAEFGIEEVELSMDEVMEAEANASKNAGTTLKDGWKEPENKPDSEAEQNEEDAESTETEDEKTNEESADAKDTTESKDASSKSEETAKTETKTSEKEAADITEETEESTEDSNSLTIIIVIIVIIAAVAAILLGKKKK